MHLAADVVVFRQTSEGGKQSGGDRYKKRGCCRYATVLPAAATLVP